MNIKHISLDEAKKNNDSVAIEVAEKYNGLMSGFTVRRILSGVNYYVPYSYQNPKTTTEELKVIRDRAIENNTFEEDFEIHVN